MDLIERKKFVRLHAIAQGIAMQEFDKQLDLINNDTGIGIGDWCTKLSEVGNNYYKAKKFDKALHYYNLSRFPYINSEVKQQAYNKCKNSFVELFKSKNINIKSLSVRYGNTNIPFYLYVNKMGNSPLLLVMGGIVSVKEQWHQFIKMGHILGFSVCLIDFPGVGENKLAYSTNSGKLVKCLLDCLENSVNVKDTHCIAMSFGGHMMIKYSVDDARIKSIITVGAPVHYFFHDTELWGKVPEITKDTLSKIMQIPRSNLFCNLQKFSIKKEIEESTIPLCYIFSNQDEIICTNEKELLSQSYKNLNLYSFDDEHGSPNHMKIIKLIVIYNLLKFSNKNSILKKLLGLKIKLAQLKLKFSIFNTAENTEL